MISRDAPRKSKGFFNLDNMKASQPHYDNGKDYDIIDIAKDYDLNFNRGNICKYVIRAGRKKDELGDLLKALDYLSREIEFIRENRDV